MNKFRALIRAKREKQKMRLHYLLAEQDIDTTQMSNRERGEPTDKGEHLQQLINVFQLNKLKATALWLANQVGALVKQETQAERALNIALSKIIITAKSR